MTARTIFLSRLIGLYCILVIPSMVLQRQATVDWMTALFHNPSLMWVLSVITLTIGLAMVLAHNVWSGGTLAAVVTLVGWAALIKGLLFLFLPSGVESALIRPLNKLLVIALTSGNRLHAKPPPRSQIPCAGLRASP